MGKFVVREVRYEPYERCGRMVLDGEVIVLFIDGVGRYLLWATEVHYTLIGLGLTPIADGGGSGQAGEAVLSGSGKGFYMTIQGKVYVTPASRVRMVMEGKHKKAPVFEKSELKE